MAKLQPKQQISFSRLRAVSRDLIYLATSPDGQELGTPFVAICQYNAGVWSYEQFTISLADMILFREPGQDYRTLHLLGENHEVINFDTKKSETITAPKQDQKRNYRLGYTIKIRHIGEHLYASGDGGQCYRREKFDQWLLLDRDLLDGPDESLEIYDKILNNPNYTSADIDRLNEETRKQASTTLWGLGGLSETDIYVCSEKGQIFHFDESRFSLSVVCDRPLLDILPQNAERIWVCGRDGALLVGNHANGFRRVPVDGNPSFNGMTLLGGQLYLSSYANPRGLFVFEGGVAKRVRTGLKPDIEDVTAIEAVDGVLWVMGTKDLLRFDGRTWERLDFPGNDPIR